MLWLPRGPSSASAISCSCKPEQLMLLQLIGLAGTSARNAEFGDLRPLRGTVQLHRRKPWLGALRAWPHLRQQHDVAELLTYLVDRLDIPGLRGCWEARTLTGLNTSIHQCFAGVPHLTLPCAGERNLQQLFEDWAFEQDTGHVRALVAPPKILCVQLLRVERNRAGETRKLEHAGHLPATLHVAHFRRGVDTLPIAYNFRSAASHIGQTPKLGHYRTFGMTAPGGSQMQDTLERCMPGFCRVPFIRPFMCRMMKPPPCWLSLRTCWR